MLKNTLLKRFEWGKLTTEDHNPKSVCLEWNCFIRYSHFYTLLPISVTACTEFSDNEDSSWEMWRGRVNSQIQWKKGIGLDVQGILARGIHLPFPYPDFMYSIHLELAFLFSTFVYWYHMHPSRPEVVADSSMKPYLISSSKWMTSLPFQMPPAFLLISENHPVGLTLPSLKLMT